MLKLQQQELQMVEDKRNMMNETVEQFLKESNAIEGVYDNYSLHQAKKAWKYLLTQEKLTTDVILLTHFTLMKNKLDPSERGHFRTFAVYIGGKEALHYSYIKEALGGWLKLMNNKLIGEKFKDLHVRYEKIHPFADGNGRTGRMFLNWQRIKAGLPILVIKESEKQEYYNWFAGVTGEN